MLPIERCKICPVKCEANRTKTAGACLAGERPRVARVMLHRWEEPPISGENGSGAVFFSGCNMRCVFCQNHEISHAATGEERDASALAELFLGLERQGAHNINLVTPAPHVFAIISALSIAKKRGLAIPIVYNTNAYERVETIEILEDVIDIFLPDFKFFSPKLAGLWGGREDYIEYAAPAIAKMQSIAGDLRVDKDGIARKGLLVRHLVLPNMRSDTYKLLEWLFENIGSNTSLSIMLQYTPMHAARFMPPLHRRVTDGEYEAVVDYALSLGFTNIFMQTKEAASAAFVPEF